MDDGLHLHPNGTISVVIEGGEWKLRRPKAGEYLRFLEALEDASDPLRMAAEQIAGERAEIAGGDDADPEAVAALRKRERGLVRDLDSARAEWVRTVLGTLSDKSPPDSDDMPVWLMQDTAVTSIVRQWREVPTHRGEK